MSGTTALALSVLIFLSMLCCYWAGQRSMWLRMRDRHERNRRWREFYDEDFED